MTYDISTYPLHYVPYLAYHFYCPVLCSQCFHHDLSCNVHKLLDIHETYPRDWFELLH